MDVQVAGNLLPVVVVEQPPPVPAARADIIPRQYCSEKSAKLLLLLVLVVFVNGVFIAAMFAYSFDPLLTIFYTFSLAFYTALYLWYWLYQESAGLRRGLGYTVFFLGDFLSAIFIYACTRFAPLQQAIAAWIFVAVPIFYSLYYVMVWLHFE